MAGGGARRVKKRKAGKKGQYDGRGGALADVVGEGCWGGGEGGNLCVEKTSSKEKKKLEKSNSAKRA